MTNAADEAGLGAPPAEPISFEAPDISSPDLPPGVYLTSPANTSSVLQ
ncbi:MAG: hypothetical protein FWD63_09695 [Propionibacteriaceae bacterium]|nr:hypothetical protein [Propionibacteriaceae bacterium]